MVQNSKDDLSQLLREKGYKITEQRKAVLEIVMEHDGEHLSSQEIYELVKKKYPDVGVATVYRTLPVLEELGYVIRSTSATAREYELHREGQQTGTILYANLGRITEVEDDLLDEIEENL